MSDPFSVASLITWYYSIPYIFGIVAFYFLLACGFDTMFDQFKVWRRIQKPAKVLSSILWPVSTILLILLGLIVLIPVPLERRS